MGSMGGCSNLLQESIDYFQTVEVRLMLYKIEQWIFILRLSLF